jgi:transcriptional regulator with XRE-family HTH domain
MAKKIKNVLELAETVGQSNAFANDLAEHLAKRVLVDKLASLRAVKGLTQKEIATKIGYSQSQVSKMEASEDFDLNLGSIVRFAEATGHCLEITLFDNEATAVDRVKHHTLCINRLTDQLARPASSANRLPQATARPRPLTVEACGVDDLEEPQETKKKPSKSRTKALCHT